MKTWKIIVSSSPNNVPLKHARTHMYTPTQQPQASTNTTTQHLSNNHPTCKNAERESEEIYTKPCNNRGVRPLQWIESFKILRRGRLRVRNFLNTSIAHAWTSVIWAGKRDSRRHSTTSFSANVVCWWREQVIKCMKFHDLPSGEGLTSFRINNRANFFSERK